MTMLSILADATPPDPMISGNWIIGVIGAIAAGIALVIGKRQGRAETQENQVTLKKPIPTLTTREESQWATMPDLDDHIARTEKQLASVWEAIQMERGIARTALGRIHDRLDTQSKVTATLQGSVEEVGKNVGRLLDLALNRKPPTGR